MNANYFTARFRVLVDGDAEQAFYPEAPNAIPGESIVRGPDRGCGGLDGPHFYVRARQRSPSACFQVSLNLTAEDTRTIVSWSWVTPDAIEDKTE